MLGFVDNFEQHFESCVLKTQNPLERALNQINGLNTSKNYLMKIFHGFRVFEYALWQKTKNPGNAGSQQKPAIANGKHY